MRTATSRRRTASSQEIIAAGGRAEALAFDVTDAAATLAALERVLEDGPVQILVNNAGVHDDAVFPGMSAAQWRGVIDVSLNGFFNVTQPLLLPMMRTRWGRIVNISSVRGGRRQPRPGQLRRGQGRAALPPRAALALELGQPRHHRERGGAGHHRRPR